MAFFIKKTQRHGGTEDIFLSYQKIQRNINSVTLCSIKKHKETKTLCLFFGSGRYKEQLKLLYKVHEVFSSAKYSIRKALWRLLSRLLSLYPGKNFVPLFLCVKILNS